MGPADADGAKRRLVDTGQSFHVAPSRPSDGSRLPFLAGEHHDCHPHTVAADGTALRTNADRGGYRGVKEFLDVPDFHGCSSDVRVRSTAGRGVFFTAPVPGCPEAPALELADVAIDAAASPTGLGAPRAAARVVEP